MKSAAFGAPALAGAVGLALSAGTAFAQPDNGPPPQGEYDWSGVYVGLNAGWNDLATHADSSTVTVNQLSGVNAGSGTVTVPPTTFQADRMRFSRSSWSGGGQVGWQKQSGHLVLGVEGDMDSLGGHGSLAAAYALPGTALTTGSDVSLERFTRPNWDASLRGRIGYAFGPALIYGTGGLAVADVTESALYGYSPTVTPAVATANPGVAYGPYANYASNEAAHTGWTVGAGGEFAVNRAVSLGLEYRYSDYGKPTYAFVSDGPDSVSETPAIRLTDSQVLAKLNFHFGPGVF
jgi:opacity protein-like surface antigen